MRQSFLILLNNYADIIVSRGSYQFWKNKTQAFKEIMRVLKPGGVAYIGRGFARDMPVEVARSIRTNQSGAMNYDRHKEAEKLQELLDELQIKNYRIEIPNTDDEKNIHYGIWVEIQAGESKK